MAHILLIDDDESVRTALRLTLIHFGHSVSEARNGNEGLAQFERTGADLVITDIVMPEKEGIETLIEFRKKYPAVKIIAISGGGRMNLGADYLTMAQRLGAGKVLAKPFSNDALMAAINDLLSGAPPVAPA